MDLQKQNILNRLVNEVPEGLPVTGGWLKDQIGSSRQLIQIYVKNNWLDNPCRGVYVRNISNMTWQSALLSLQKVCGLDCHAAGISALQMLGFAQYLLIGEEVNVKMRGSDPPPPWLDKLELSASFQYNGRRLFGRPDIGGTEFSLSGYSEPLIISSVPKAFLEVLSEVTDEYSFNSAYELFEGMTSLNPTAVKELLDECRNVKSLRLFFLMLEKAGHQWGKKLNSGDYYLGTGKRVVVKGGKLNKKYAVTVPEGFND